MSNDKKVYVPNKGTHDYTKAWDFGDLVFCTDGVLNRKDLNSMHAQLAEAMDDMMEDDYILITSLSSLCSIACAIFAHRFGRLNLLLHSGDSYLERTILL